MMKTLRHRRKISKRDERQCTAEGGEAAYGASVPAVNKVVTVKKDFGTSEQTVGKRQRVDAEPRAALQTERSQAGQYER
jgi:hypothetical protein